MKLGPHIQNASEVGVRWARSAPIVKAIDEPGPLAAAGPGAITVFRAHVRYQDVMGPEEFFWVTRHRLRGFRPTYIEALNEHKQHIGEGLADYIEWTRRFAKVAHSHGYKVAGFSFSTGSPEPEDWALLRKRDFAGVDAIALHEYWGRQGFSTWHALRYRRAHEWAGGAHPPFLITECGRDAVEGAERQAGWKAQGVSGDEYLAELLAYNAELELDDYVLGATPFTCGPGPDWANFDVDELVERLSDGGRTEQDGKDS